MVSQLWEIAASTYAAPRHSIALALWTAWFWNGMDLGTRRIVKPRMLAVLCCTCHCGCAAALNTILVVVFQFLTQVVPSTRLIFIIRHSLPCFIRVRPPVPSIPNESQRKPDHFLRLFNKSSLGGTAARCAPMNGFVLKVVVVVEEITQDPV